MRFLYVAFVITALGVSTPLTQAQDGISPEVFAACEAKTPNDFKQQLVCVKEQSAALDALKALKKGKTRQIAVTPKAAEVGEKKPKSSNGLDENAAAQFCDSRREVIGTLSSPKICIEDEIAAHAAMAEAIDTVDSDIPGHPFISCRNYITAFQPLADDAYLPQQYMLQCLKAKAPTRDFGRCYQNYERRVFTRDVKTVSAENASYIVGCFLHAMAGGP